MIRKLMMHTTSTLIGHKLVIACLLFSISGCWQLRYDHRYDTVIKNGTDYTLMLVIGDFPQDTYLQDTLLMEAFEEISYPDQVEFLESDDTISIMKEVLYGLTAFSQSVRVYKSDSLCITWTGPGREMEDSIHHLYNFYSWEFIPKDDYDEYLIDGKIMFTILESDF